MCGDDPAALRTVGQLVRDAGGVPAALGPLDRTRQLEEVAGFVIGLAFAGVDPRYAIPSVPMPAASGDPGYRP
jgi:8-hydroxy-5-deazaflavin:NADPH oxidoreductase